MTFAYPNSWTIEGEEISNGEFMGVRTLTLSSFGQPKRQGGVRKAGRQQYIIVHQLGASTKHLFLCTHAICIKKGQVLLPLF